MRARAILGSALAAFGILGIGWEVGTTAGGGTSTVSGSGAADNPTGSSGAATPDASGTTAPTTTSATTDGTFTGSVAGTRFGDVQVQVTISGGRLTDVTALQLTDADGRSVQISNRAAPILRQEVLDAQSARVQMVGGATYTSDAYLTSLQSALDQAGWVS